MFKRHKKDKPLTQQVLADLKKTESYVSGEELALRYDISRQALWKHINQLVSQGYEIVAVPHLGYKLVSVPDKLYPWEIQYDLKTKFIGKEIVYRDSVNSTQDHAWQLAEKNSVEGCLVVAERQKKGRGRMMRKWISSKGGIYFSLILWPTFLPIYDIPQITLLIALACLYAIKRVTGVECSVKWPNDIFLNGKKVAGILSEVSAELDRVRFIVVGIGVNVNTRDLPPEGTSLFLNRGEKFSRIEIFKAILEEIERLYSQAKTVGFKDILKDWKKFCNLWGHTIKVNLAGQELVGEAVGIDDKGYLIVRAANGLLKKISAGDVIFK